MIDQTTLTPDQVVHEAYHKPEVIHELQLETRAGSPLGGDPLVDPLGLDPTAQ